RRHRVLGRDIVLRFALGGGALHRTLYRRGQGGAIGRFVLSPGAGFGVTLSGPGCVPGRGRATSAAATPSRRLQPLPCPRSQCPAIPSPSTARMPPSTRSPPARSPLAS